MINYTLEKRFQNVTLPPEKPEEIYPDDGPPPLTSMMNVTIQPNVFFFRKKKKKEKKRKEIPSSNCIQVEQI